MEFNPEPLVFTPYLKQVIWGGDKICRYKGIEQAEPQIGESWEISAVPGHESVVENGTYKGEKITDLIEKYGADLLGTNVVERYGKFFPLLIKIIDASDNLSVQVHPDDELAARRHGCLGKTEMWYIISTDDNASIYSGLNKEITPEEYEKLVADGSFADVIATHSSHAGDVFFLPAGRVHAIGAGNLLAEIQESSDITYRIFDYNRTDSQGKTRELHTAQAKDAIDYEVSENYKTPAPDDSVADAEIVKCEHFTTRRILLDGVKDLPSRTESFQVLMCIEGNVTVNYGTDGKLSIRQGQTLLLPALIGPVELEGNATLLLSYLE